MSQNVHMFGKVKGCGSLTCVEHAADGRPDRQIRKIRGMYGNTGYYGVLHSTQTPGTILMPCLLKYSQTIVNANAMRCCAAASIDTTCWSLHCLQVVSCTRPCSHAIQGVGVAGTSPLPPSTPSMLPPWAQSALCRWMVLPQHAELREFDHASLNVLVSCLLLLRAMEYYVSLHHDNTAVSALCTHTGGECLQGSSTGSIRI
jgi:hypothetical protein